MRGDKINAGQVEKTGSNESPVTFIGSTEYRVEIRDDIESNSGRALVQWRIFMIFFLWGFENNLKILNYV